MISPKPTLTRKTKTIIPRLCKKGRNLRTSEKKIANHRLLVLKTNQIPKGLIPLERLFDQNDMPLKSTLQPQPEEVEDCDVGTTKEPRIVKLSKYLPPEIKNKYTDLLRRYKDVFAWSYDELRTYDTFVIEHKIPLKLGVKPFRQRLRQINPILLPVVEREVKKLLDAKIIVPLVDLCTLGGVPHVLSLLSTCGKVIWLFVLCTLCSILYLTLVKVQNVTFW
jgi:hypothetical protein